MKHVLLETFHLSHRDKFHQEGGGPRSVDGELISRSFVDGSSLEEYGSLDVYLYFFER